MHKQIFVVVLWITVFVSVAAAPAFGDGAGPITSYVVPDECPKKDEFSSAISQQLIDGHDTGELALEIQKKGPREYTLVLNSEQGERRLQGNDCRELVLSAALIVVMASDVKSDEQPLPNEEEREDEPTELLPKVFKPSNETLSDSLHMSLGVETQLNLGVLLDTAIGFGASVSLLYKPWRLVLRGSLPLEQRQQFFPGEGSTFSYRSIDTRLCRESTTKRAVYGVCAGGYYGQIRSVAFGFVNGLDETHHFAGPTLSGYVSVLLHPKLWWNLGITLSVPMPRTRYVIRLSDMELLNNELHRTSIVSVLLNFGVDWVFL